jgi:protein TonB
LQESHQQMEGIVAFYVDENGNLTHQAIYRASGRADLDAAALNAVRRATPFPPPPPGDPHAIWFHFDTR